MSKSTQLAQVFRLRRNLYYSGALLDFIGTTPTAEKFDKLVETVWSLMPNGIEESTIRKSIEPLAGQPFDQAILSDLSWRLAGNCDRLKDGRAVMPWTVQKDNELVPVQIIEAYPTTRYGEMATKLFCRALAGTCCPMILDTTWTGKQAGFRSRHLGFSAPWGKYSYQHPMQLVGMRMTVMVDADKSTDKPYFDQSLEQEPSSILNYNKALLKRRARVKNAKGEGFDCPFDFDHPCHLCPVGYDKCSVACHPKTYEEKICDRCQTLTWFDPAKPKQKFCLDCHYQSLSKDRFGLRNKP